MFFPYAAYSLVLGAAVSEHSPFKTSKAVHEEGPAQNAETEANDSF